MIKEIIAEVTEKLKAAGNIKVYSAFDNIPAECKKGVYAVVSMKSFESTAPIFSEHFVYIPVKAKTEISLLAPPDTTAAELYEIFDSNILPLADSMAGMSCSLSSLAIKADSNLNRLVLKSEFSISGISRFERSGS